jgi:hypothetical protein
MEREVSEGWNLSVSITPYSQSGRATRRSTRLQFLLIRSYVAPFL